MMKQLSNLLSYMIPDAHFDPRVRMKRWDGRIRLLQNNMFQIGLLYRVLEYLRLEKQEVKLNDMRKDVSVKIDTSFFDKVIYEDKKPRYYQKDTLVKFVEFFEKYKVYRGIASLPPRSGKTFISGILNKATNLYPTIFIVHKIDLARQTKSVFEKMFKMKIGLVGDGEFDIDSDIVISTIQSIANTFDIGEKYEDEKDFDKHDEFKKFLATVKFCIIDEAHVSGTMVWAQLPKALKKLKVLIGLSGTPYREDNADLLIEQLCGPIIHTVDRDTLVEEGFLLPIRVYFIYLPPVKLTGYAWQTQKKEAIIKNPYVRSAVEKLINRFEKKDLSSIVMLREKNHANFINKKLKLEFLNGDTSGLRREEVYKELNNKDRLSIISNVTDIGVDIPTLDNCIIIDVNQSKISAFQRLRCGTPDGKKKYGNIIYLCPQIILPDDYKRYKIKNYIENHWRKVYKLYSAEPTFKIIEKDYEEL